MSLTSFQKQAKYIALGVVSLGLFALTIFLGRGASQVFFAKAGSCPAKNVRAERVGPNSAAINWDTDDKSQGQVEYGTNAISLTFNTPEASEETVHNVPLTLLTPNTVYYYLVAIGGNKCDSSGNRCEEGSCVPYSFTTTTLNPQVSRVVDLPTPTKILTGGPQGTPEPLPTSSLSLFCKAVQANIGKNETIGAEWASLKTYDIDGNGIINGLDVVKCQQSGK